MQEKRRKVLALLLFLFLTSSLCTGIKKSEEKFIWGSFKPNLRNRILDENFSFPLREKWYFDTNANVFDSAAVYGNLVFFGSSNSYGYAVYLNNGSLIWKHNFELPVISSPLVFEDNNELYVIFASLSGKIYKIKAESGEIVKSIKLKPFSGSSPLLYRDFILIGGGRELYAINKTSFSIAWSFETNASIFSAPSVYEAGKAIVFIGSLDKNLYAIDIKTGKKLWNFKAEAQVMNSPAVGKNKLFFGDYAGNFYAISIENGSLIWHFRAGDNIRAAPVYDESSDTVYFASFDGNLYALKGESGEELWRFFAASRMHASPLLTRNAIFIAGNNGKIYAIDKKSGEVMWKASIGAAVRGSPSVGKIKGRKIILFGALNGLYAFEEVKNEGEA